jgi:hypothetical protein
MNNFIENKSYREILDELKLDMDNKFNAFCELNKELEYDEAKMTEVLKAKKTLQESWNTLFELLTFLKEHNIMDYKIEIIIEDYNPKSNKSLNCLSTYETD